MTFWITSIKKQTGSISLINFSSDINEENYQNKTFFLGHPRIEDKNIQLTDLKKILNEDHVESFAKLDGSFLLADLSKNNKATFVTDRFLSYKLFLLELPNYIFIGNNFFDICKHARKNGERLTINENSLFEFLYFRRQFGTTTLIKECRLINPASILKIVDGRISQYTYWEPTYEPFLSSNTAVEELAESLRNSVKNTYSSHVNTSLLLSGGLDSRALLAAQTPKNAITLGPKKNNEYRVAHQLAAETNVQSIFIQRIPGLIDNVVDKVIRLTDGEHSISGFALSGYDNEFLKYSKNFSLGLYLDVLFGGLYLPKSKLKLFGYTTEIYKLDNLENNIADHFINNVKYKMKSNSFSEIFKEKIMNTSLKSLREKIEGLAKDESAFTENPYSIWESLHLKPMSRHYSFSMISSLRNIGSCSVPAFDNKLLNLSRKISPNHKINSYVYKKAIKLLNPELMKIDNANINVSAEQLPLNETITIFTRKFINRYLHFNTKIPPKRDDRTWAHESKIIKESIFLTSLIKNLGKSDIFSSLEILNQKNIHNAANDFLDGSTNNSILLFYLITVEYFLNEILK